MGRNKKDLPFIFLFFLMFISCEKNTDPLAQSNGPAITVALNVEDVTCTEAWLRLTAENLPEGATYHLLRDDSLVQHGEMSTSDTLLYDEGLLPNRNYVYRALLLKDKKQIASSGEITVTTMDTTSHDLQWQTFEFPSPYGSGALYDVAIINENDIWAVGEIYSDTVQTWLPYNAVHWDGQQWELKRIKTNACGGVDYPPIKTVIDFSHNDVLFAHIDGSITYCDGNHFNND